MRLSVLWLAVVLAVVLTGCCTSMTVDTATHAYRHDSVARIEKAGIAADGTLVVLVDGATAESPRIKQFTITTSLASNEDKIWLPREGMREGWRTEYFDRGDTTPVTVPPPVELAAYQSPKDNAHRFRDSSGDHPTLYLVRHAKPDRQTSLYYVGKGDISQKVEIGLNGREVKTPGRYPLLLLVPITIPVDIVALPLELYFFSSFGDARAPSGKERISTSIGIPLNNGAK